MEKELLPVIFSSLSLSVPFSNARKHLQGLAGLPGPIGIDGVPGLPGLIGEKVKVLMRENQ